MTDDWHELLKRGFGYVADWVSDGEARLSLDKELPGDPGVYVFVCNDDVVYVGVTMMGLSRRLKGYVSGYAGQRTNARVKENIVSSLANGDVVRILFAKPETMLWNGWPVLTSHGLEQGLIQVFRPKWNVLGTA
ncbi:GIY-YIG nuclease family protein [Seohaeicola saemankumensis]|nr:GIY-YIG nuclease family protein [Seohaeicola saemankumensis]MCA0872293.1 GIY-YIG nuclease family protein [Seohaeicola saemankumensis]